MRQIFRNDAEKPLVKDICVKVPYHVAETPHRLQEQIGLRRILVLYPLRSPMLQIAVANP
jgi:hypothetical protein